MAETKPSEHLTKYSNKMRVMNLDTDPRQPWDAKSDTRNPFHFAACHWGQLKLMYTELEFLTLASASYDLAKCTVVSVGAAPGHSVSLLRKLFPELKFILVDPAPFVAKRDSHVVIHNTIFTDESVGKILEDNLIEQRKLLFISDIRLTVDDTGGFEDAVFEDMLAQQRWGIQLNAEMIMVKFRMPFSDNVNSPRDMRYDYTMLRGEDKASRITMGKNVPKNPDMVAPGTMVYLDGEIRYQLYPPSDSAETRLIARKAKNGKYTLRTYDYLAYEETMAHYNTVTRRAKYSFPGAAMIAPNIAGFESNSFECASEVAIVSEYLRVVLKRSYQTTIESAKDITQLIFAIHRDMWQVTKRSMISCHVGTPLDAYKNKNFNKVVSRILLSKSDSGVQYSLDILRRSVATSVKIAITKALAQIDHFTSIISTPPQSIGKTNTVFLRRTDYIAQLIWLRSEIEKVKTHQTTYESFLTNQSPQNRNHKKYGQRFK